MEKLLEETIDRFENTPIQTDPFSHLIIDRIFSESFYKKIMDHIPDRFYYQSTKEYPQRFSFTLDEDHLNLLTLDPHLFDFWSQFANAVYSKKFLEAILKKFGLKNSPSIRPVAQLIRDRDHYSIGPHTDIPEKLITLLFYLPMAENQHHLGTALYQPKNPQFTCSGKIHHPFEPFIKVAKAPFNPNSVFGFIRSDTSFHGVEPIGIQEKERNLMTYTIWKTQ